MNNYAFLKTYSELQKGITTRELYDLDFALVWYCEDDKSPFWNNALVNTILTKDKVSAVEVKLKNLDRKSAFYFENRPDLTDLSHLLAERGYSKMAEDSWMFYTGTEIDKSKFDSVKKVESTKELQVFLDTFDQCYRKDDPLNPYGELGDYLKSARKAWKNSHKSNRVEYFIVYQDDKPVAVSTLTNHKSIGYISNVGSLLNVRGQGYGSLATIYCVQQSINNGNTTHCLATEEGTYPNKFYKATGFKTKFTAILMVKK